MEQDQAKLMSQRQQEIIEKYRKAGIINGSNHGSVDVSGLTQDYILKEISATLSHRKKLRTKVSRLETELTALQKVTEDRKPQINLYNPGVKIHNGGGVFESSPVGVPDKVQHAHPLLQPPIVANHHSHTSSKPQRKSRENRSRSQDWPDVPDIGKIEENNPEILAQKILETGRQIEAGKIREVPKFNGNHNPPGHHLENMTVTPDISPGNSRFREYNAGHHYTNVINTKQQEHVINSQALTKNRGGAPQPEIKLPKQPRSSCNGKIGQYQPTHAQEPPRVANFEDRLKSIITSVLNEDQQNRQAAQVMTPTCTNSSSNNYSVVNNLTSTVSTYSVNGNYYSSANNTNTTICNSNIPTTETCKVNREVKKPISDSERTYRREQERCTATIQPRNITALQQPDYTQVSPAKLALRRHLSQEKLAAASAQQIQALGSNEKGFVATRTIGDLVSGEIERTLEISNQSIINAAVDMSTMMVGNTTTPATVVNQNLPPRPERVNVRVNPVADTASRKDEERISVGSTSPPHRTPVYSPISRPSSTEAVVAPPGNPPTPTGILHQQPPALEGLAYPQHRPKSPMNQHSHNGLATLAHAAYTHMHSNYTPQTTAPPSYSPRTTVLYPTSSSSSFTSRNTAHVTSSCRYSSSCNNESNYTPVQLPRADIKPYHESYFADTKPPIIVGTSQDHKLGNTIAQPEVSCAKPPSRNGSETSFAPVEGLAATLRARILGGRETSNAKHVRSPDSLTVKVEIDDTTNRRSDCVLYDDRQLHQRLDMVKSEKKFDPESKLCEEQRKTSEQINLPQTAVPQLNANLNTANIQIVASSVDVKTELIEGTPKSESDENFGKINPGSQYHGNKRASPVILGPVRLTKKQHLSGSTSVDCGSEADSGVSSLSSLMTNASQPLAISAISSPELNSGKSTPTLPLPSIGDEQVLERSSSRLAEDREEGRNTVNISNVRKKRKIVIMRIIKDT